MHGNVVGASLSMRNVVLEFYNNYYCLLLLIIHISSYFIMRAFEYWSG